jgi:hypothetical protein
VGKSEVDRNDTWLDTIIWSGLWKLEISYNMKCLYQMINVKLMKDGDAEVFWVLTLCRLVSILTDTSKTYRKFIFTFKVSGMNRCAEIYCINHTYIHIFQLYFDWLTISKMKLCIFRESENTYNTGVLKSLARPGRKKAAPVKSVMGRGMDWFG